MQIWHTDPTITTSVATYIHRTLRVRGVPYQRRGLFARNDVRSAGESGTHSSLQYTHPTAPSYKKGRADNRPLSTPKLVSPHLRDVLSSHPRLRGWRMVEAGPPIASGCDGGGPYQPAVWGKPKELPASNSGRRVHSYLSRTLIPVLDSAIQE